MKRTLILVALAGCGTDDAPPIVFEPQSCNAFPPELTGCATPPAPVTCTIQPGDADIAINAGRAFYISGSGSIHETVELVGVSFQAGGFCNWGGDDQTGLAIALGDDFAGTPTDLTGRDCQWFRCGGP